MLPPFFHESYFTKHLQGTACKELVIVQQTKYLLLWQSCARTTVKISSEKYCGYFQNIGKILRSPKRNRNMYLQIEKTLSEKFRKIQPKESLMKPFFKRVTTNFSEKELHQSYFPMIFGSFLIIVILWGTCQQLFLKKLKGYT